MQSISEGPSRCRRCENAEGGAVQLRFPPALLPLEVPVLVELMREEEGPGQGG
jgi:hypothetical protein